MSDADRLHAMGEAAAGVGERGADELLADMVEAAFAESGVSR